MEGAIALPRPPPSPPWLRYCSVTFSFGFRRIKKLRIVDVQVYVKLFVVVQDYRFPTKVFRLSN